MRKIKGGCQFCIITVAKLAKDEGKDQDITDGDDGVLIHWGRKGSYKKSCIWA